MTIFKTVKNLRDQASFKTLSLFLLLFISYTASAEIFVLEYDGSWNETHIWKDNNRPGTTIDAGDEVIIEGRVSYELFEDLIINGKLTIASAAQTGGSIGGGITFSGDKVVRNNGQIIIGNKGYLKLYYSFELRNDWAATFTNNGLFEMYSLGQVHNHSDMTNNGTMVFGGNKFSGIPMVFNNYGILTNNNNSTITFKKDGSSLNNQFFTGGGTPQVINNGTINNFSTINNIGVGSIVNNDTIYNCKTFANDVGTINNTGTFINNANLINDDYYVQGIFNQNAGGYFEINTPQNHFVDGTLNWNGGTLAVGFSGNMSLGGLTIDAGKTLDIKGRFSTNTPLVNNGSTIIRGSGGNLVLNYANAILPTGATYTWNNGGKVTVGAAGSMALNTPFSPPLNGILGIEGTVNVNPGAKVFDHNGQVKIEDGGNLVFNTVDTVGLNITMTGGSITVGNSGHLVLDQNSYLIIPANGFLSNNGDVTIATNLFRNDGTLTNNGTCNINYGFFNTGTLLNNGSISNEYGYIANTGIFTNAGSLSITQYSNLHLGVYADPNYLFLHDGINNTGTINLENGSDLTYKGDTITLFQGTVNWNAGASVTIDANSKLPLSQDLDIPLGTTFINVGNIYTPSRDINNYGSFINQGIVNLDAGSDFTNHQTFNNQSGTLNLNGGSSFLVPISVSTLPGGTIGWNGGMYKVTSEGELNITSPISLPLNSIVQIDGDLNINSGGTLSVNGVLNNNGNIRLNGTGTVAGSGSLNLNTGSYYIINTPVFSNPATVVNPLLGSTITLGSPSTLNLTSAYNIPAGTSFKVEGSLNVNSGGSVSISGSLINAGNSNINGTGSLGGTGSLFLSPGSTFNFNNINPIAFPGNITWTGGNMVVGAIADVTMPNAFTIPVSSSLIINGILRVGTIGFSGAISSNGTFILNSTGKIYLNTSSDLSQITWNGGGTIIVNPSVDFIISNPLTIPNGCLFENYGAVQIGNTGSSFTLNAGAIFNVYNGASVSFSAPITNNGVINLQSGGQYILRHDTTLPVPSANFNWEMGGTLASGGGAYLSLENNYTVPNGRILKMDGGVFSVNKKLTNEGTIDLLGNLNITDTLEQNNDLNILSGSIRTQITGVLVLNDTINYTVNDTIKTDGVLKINQGGALIGDGIVELKSGHPSFENGRICLNQTVADFDLNKIIWNYGSSIIIGENSTYESPNNFTIPSDKKFQVDGLMTIKTDSTFENNGYLTVNGTFNDNGRLNNNASGTFTNNGIGNINGIFFNNGEIENTDILNLKATGALTLNTGNISLDGTFNWLEGGDLTIGPNANMYLSNTLTIPAASTLNVDGLLEIRPNGVIANNGTLSLNTGGEFVIKDTTSFITSTNFIWNSGANIRIADGGLVSLSQPFTIPINDTLKLDRGVLELNPGGIVTNNGSIELNAYGNIILKENPDFLVNGDFNWNNQGQVTIGTGMVFNMTSDLTVAYSGILENNGKMIIAAGKTLSNLGVITNNDSLINNGTLVNTNSGNSQINNYGVFMNNGTINSDKLFYHYGELVLNTSGIVFPFTAFHWQNGGNVTIGENGILALSSLLNFNENSAFNIEGILNLNAGGSIIGQTNLASGATLGLNITAKVDATSFSEIAGHNLISSYNWEEGGIVKVNASGNLTSLNGFSIPQNSFLSVSGSYTLESYASTDPVIANNGTIEVNSGGVFNQKHSLLNNGSILINDGGRMNQKAAINNVGLLDLNTNGTLSFGEPIYPNDSVPILGAGNFNWNGGTVEVTANSIVSLENEFTIPPGRTFTNLGTLNIEANGVLTHLGTLTNTGTFDIKEGGEYRIKKAIAAIPSGTFNWTAGKLTIDTASVLNLTNTLLIPPLGNLEIEKGAILNINSGGVLTQAGTLDINQGHLNLNTGGTFILKKLNASIPATGFTWNAGTLQLVNSGSLVLSNSLNIPAGGTFELDGTLSVDNGGLVNNLGNFNLNNGGLLTFNASSAILPNGNFNWVSGGDINIKSGSTLNLIEPLGIPAGGTLTNNGTLNINNLGILGNSGAYNGTGITNLNTGGKYLILDATNNVPSTNFNWNAGGIFEITATGTLTLTDSLTVPFERTLINKGQLNINQNGVLTQMGAVDNQGAFDLNDTGYLILKTSPLEANPGSVSYPNGTFNWNTGGIIKVDSLTTFNNQSLFEILPERKLIVCGTFENNSTLDIEGTLILAGNLTNNSTINLYNLGTLDFETPTVTFPAGSFNWLGGGDVRIGINSSLTLSTPLSVPLSSTLNNNGNLVINNNGLLEVNGNLENNGTLDLNAGGKYLINSLAFGPFPSFNWNNGGLIEIGPNGDLRINEPFAIPFGRTLVNKGELRIGNGSLNSTAKVTVSGAFDNTAGSLDLQPYGTLEYKKDASDLGMSSFNYPRGAFDWKVGGLVLIAENTTFDNQSTFEVKSARELEIDGIFKNNGTLSIVGTVTVNGDLINETTGTLNLNDYGNLIIDKEGFTKPANTFNWASGGTLTIGLPGSMDVNSPLDIPNGGILNIEGTVNLVSGGTLNNFGTINLSFGSNLFLDFDNAPLPTGTFNWDGRVIFAENKTFNISGNYVVPPSGNLKNEGMLFINSDGSLTVDGLFFNDSLLTNNGLIEVTEFGYIANYVELTNNDSLLNKGTIENYGPFINASNGNLINGSDLYNFDTLYNHGTLSGNYGKIYAETDSEIKNLVGSKVSPGDGLSSGKMSIQGDLDLENALLSTKIDRNTNGDLLDVSQHATLTNAKLDVSWLNNPSNNQIDTVIAFGTKTGEFASVNIQPLSGYTFTVNYLANAVVIKSALDCQTSVSETSSLSGTQTISSGQHINASSIISINAKITFSTGGSITLEPGFKTESNAVFLANIDGGCLD